MLTSRLRSFAQPLPVIVALAIALAVGASVPLYVDALGDSAAKLLALPAIVILTFLITLSRTTLLMIIVFLRASTESIFEASRFSVGGAPIGVGGLLNLFAILIALLLVAERPDRFSKTIVKIWGGFLAMVLFGVVNSPDPVSALRFLLQWMSNFAIFVGAFYFVRTEDDFKRIVKLVLWSSVIPAAYGLLQAATGGGYLTPDAGMRTNSTFNHPNIFAFYLTIVISLAIYMMKSERFAVSARSRWAIGAYVLVLLALLVLTKTRSAWAATFAVFVLYGLLFERRYLVYILVAGVACLFIPNIGDRLGDLTAGGRSQISSYDQLNSFAWRVSLWTSGLSWMTPGHYLTGYGLESFKYYVIEFFDDITHTHWGAHNVYVQLIFDLGALGLASFLWMYAQVLLQVRRMIAWDRQGAFFVGMLVIEFLVVAYSDNMLDYQSFNWYLWFVIGAAIAVSAPMTRPTAPAVLRPIWETR